MVRSSLKSRLKVCKNVVLDYHCCWLFILLFSMFLKKTLLGLWFSLCFFYPSFLLAQTFQDWFGINEQNVSDVKVPWSGENQQENILDVVKKVINYILGLLALITLILLIWWWLQMLFAAESDDGYKKWFTILKNAAIALAFIALSWLIVSFIFYFLDVVTQ